jgi:hypothetical protein
MGVCVHIRRVACDNCFPIEVFSTSTAHPIGSMVLSRNILASPSYAHGISATLAPLVQL